MSFSTIRSTDGTPIAFEAKGKGEALILVGGAFCDRSAPASGTPLAAALSDRFTVFSYDRRGRGDSEDRKPGTTDREIEDLGALMAAAGGTSALFGNSSGGLLAIDAAIQGYDIPKLVLYEPPVILNADQARSLESLATEIDRAVRENRRAEAVEAFMTRVMQMTSSAVSQMRKSPMWPGLEGLAHTLAYDLRMTARGPQRQERLSAVHAPTIVLCGSGSPDWLRQAIEEFTGELPNARFCELEGQSHHVDPKVLSGAIRDFLSS